MESEPIGLYNKSMSEQEGVIQFSLQHRQTPAVDLPVIRDLSAWHARLHVLQLVGQDPVRYEGYAYGNLSARIDHNSFIISGTQTGNLPQLDSRHYAIVDACDSKNNTVQSHGPLKPSSECMTHAAVYAASREAKAVCHVHSAAIWTNADQLGIHMTDPTILYGTPAMADAVTAFIAARPQSNSAILCMGGHIDGVLAWGEAVEQACQLILDQLKPQ